MTGWVLSHFIQSLAHSLNSDGRLAVRGFGAFRVVVRKPRWIAHPTTGRRLRLPANLEVRFRASKSFKRAIERGTQSGKAADASS